jgi:hypothetical protein
MVTATSMMMVGCYRGPTAVTVYGRASNPDRVKRGLPVIPITWIERGGGPQADWVNPACSNPATTHDPMHSHKDLFIDKSGNPLKETDYYQSGKWYPGLYHDPDDPNSKKLEELYITYDFEAARAGKNPWYCEVNGGPHARMPTGEVTLDEAEAMLKEWGLKRLD